MHDFDLPREKHDAKQCLDNVWKRRKNPNTRVGSRAKDYHYIHAIDAGGGKEVGRTFDEEADVLEKLEERERRRRESQ